MPKIWIAVIAVVVIGFVFYTYQNKSQPAPSPTSEQTAAPTSPDGTFAFEIISDPNKPGSSYVIVGSQTKDVREELPIYLEYFKNGVSAWKGTIDGDPAKICRDKTGCGIDGPNFADLNISQGDTLEMVATTADGTVLAKDSGAIN